MNNTIFWNIGFWGALNLSINNPSENLKLWWLITATVYGIIMSYYYYKESKA